MEAIYDSRPDTKLHIARVQELIGECRERLQSRAAMHDLSKLRSPEREVFDRVTPKLRELTYGSDEYKASLDDMGDALLHHYTHNSHHPEHYINGVNGMSLLDALEMFMDWKAASERHANGNIRTSIENNRTRFKLSDQLCDMLHRTADELGWT